MGRVTVQLHSTAAVAERLDVCVCADLSLAGMYWQMQPAEQAPLRAAIT